VVLVGLVVLVALFDCLLLVLLCLLCLLLLLWLLLVLCVAVGCCLLLFVDVHPFALSHMCSGEQPVDTPTV
jgi:hypothetical protein